MNLRNIRLVVALIAFAFLFVFFVPLIYDATMLQCSYGAEACFSNPSGLKSLGYTIFHWGGAYSLGGAGDPQVSGYAFLPDGFLALPDGTHLTAYGVLLFVALPFFIGGIGLLAPEITRKSKLTRIGFTIFGAFVLILSVLMLFTMWSEGFNLALATLAITLFPAGFVMTIYGTRRRILSECPQGSQLRAQ